MSLVTPCIRVELVLLSLYIHLRRKGKGIVNMFIVCVLVVVSFCCTSSTSSIEWLGISQHRYTWLRPVDCYAARRDGFSMVHARFCHRFLDLMPHVHTASREILAACTSVFSRHRWNCSSLLFAPNLPTELRIGTAEQAFVEALTAALLTHRFARLCASQQSSRCSCGQTKHVLERNIPTINRLNGCNDNTEFGSKFSRIFIEANYRRRPLRRLRYRSLDYHSTVDSYASFMMAISRHNYALGRQIVIDSVKRKCKCSGVSGSCTIRTCWQAVSSPDILARRLKQRYENAIEVAPRLLDDDDEDNNNNRPQFIPTDRIRRIHSTDLLYWSRSPDYCYDDNSLFSTRGRLCNSTLNPHTEGSCHYLCCGRGYETKRYFIRKQCHCHYVHCCYIQCDTCLTHVDEHICK